MSVANRVLLSFLVAAVLPLLLLAGSAYRMAESRLQDAALRDAHELAKTIGMDVFERLRFVTDHLTLIARGVRPGDEARLPLRSLDLGGRIEGLFRIGTDGKVYGDLAPETPVGRSILAAAADGDAALPLLLAYGGLADRRLFLLVPDPAHAGGRFVGAEVNVQHLWDTAGIANRPEAVCILGPDDRPVYCNRGDHEDWLLASAGLLATRAHPEPVSTADGERLLTAAWPLFLKPHYQFDRWTVVVGIPQRLALRSIDAFDQVFGGVVVMGLLVALWLGRRMIRSNLMPLQQLSEATRQLAAGDFSRRIDLRSGDEFEQLGSAFDRMAEQIGRQFDELDALAGLDRRLQLATDYEQMTLAAALCFDRLLGAERTALVCHERGPVAGPLLCRPFGAPAVAHCRAGSNRMSRHQLVESMFVQLAVDKTGDIDVIGVTEGDMIAMAVAVRDPSPAELKLVKRINDVLSIALQNLAMERSMAHRANHDWLTELPNRICLAGTFERTVEERPEGHCIGMLMLGISRFKQINDSIGHAGGDGLLAKVGRRLRDALPGDVVLTRFSGDQFVALVDAPARGDVETMLRRLADDIAVQLDQPTAIGPRSVRLAATMGAAVYPGDAEDFEQMLQCLDAAMHTAKTERRNALVFFTRGMRDKLAGRMDFEQALKGALRNRELELHYQPVIDLASGRVISAEALMRWRRPGHGMVPPGDFIELAEQSGLIHELGRWALQEVCRQMQAWRQAGLGLTTLNVNISSVQLDDDAILAEVDGALRAAGLPPACLTLEVTETALIGRFEEGVERLKRLKSLGVHVMIDDFGTGYASLKYLKLLPIDGLKIDRLFVRDLPDSASDDAIVTALTSLARASRLKLVAEGVETGAQADLLGRRGVPYLQGFLYSPGLPADAFERFARERSAGTVPASAAPTVDPLPALS